MIYSENILLCIAIPLAITLVFLQGSARRFSLSFMLGMVTCLLSAYISGYVGLLAQAGATETAVYFSPVIEESMKLLPAVIFLALFEPSEREAILCAVALGAGFATFENCCYLLSAGSESLRFTLVRGLAVGVMHVVSMVAVSLGVLLARRYHTPPLAGTIGALGMSTTFHALYNLLVSEPGVTSYVGFALPLLMTALLYVPYRRMVGQDLSFNEP